MHNMSAAQRTTVAATESETRLTITVTLSVHTVPLPLTAAARPSTVPVGAAPSASLDVSVTDTVLPVVARAVVSALSDCTCAVKVGAAVSTATEPVMVPTRDRALVAIICTAQQ